ncbi:MAG TPA: hypothetical protein VK151_18465 [Fluviicola sp.]|nr:hypothetical protein [Fluviicola sp.]
MKHILLFICILSACLAKADFVDIATISVNGKMVRKLTNNSRDLYLINFDNYQIGDTVKVKIWTDYGGEQSCFVTLKNLLSNDTDTLGKKKQFMLTEEIMSGEFLVSVTFFDPFDTNRFYKWDICKIVPNHRIEVVYETINEMKNLLLSLKSKKNTVSSPLLKDSLYVNFRLPKPGTETRLLSDTTYYPATKLSDILQFTKTEISYLERYNSVDYFQQYDFETDIHGSIRVAEATLDHFQVSFGAFNYSFSFDLQWDSEKYILESIFYESR